ncbi:MAG: hypothetical protein JWQ84_2732 [Mucilaginibacter sp.]|nr:hypothetical protein [Mucilaginibacter sp.]MDB5017900.1 hypothetical protein [Mucilaginibacter sp.]MDB5139825.1 hypothetical protein [Mucilaginibacter sp.]
MKKLVYILLIPVMFCTCKKSGSPVPLTVARQMAGNWTTPNPVTFYYSSDGCGGYSRYSSFKMKVNWQITATGDNSISVTWNLVSYSAQTLIGSNCGLGAPPLTFPQDFVGIVTGSKFSMDQNQTLQGVFNFTTDNITGTMSEKDCLIYCSGYSTDQNTFILTRVN